MRRKPQPVDTYYELPFSAVAVVFVACIWSLLFNVGLWANFMHVGPGRSLTPLETPEGQQAVIFNIISCQLAGSPLPPLCVAQLMGWQAALSSDVSKVPLLMFFGVCIDTWPKWSLLALFAVSIYSLSNLLHNTIQAWIIEHLQNRTVSVLRHSPGVTYAIRLIWCATEFTFFPLDIVLGPLQVDILLLSFLSYVITSFTLTHWYMRGRAGNGEHVLVPTGPTQPTRSEPLNIRSASEPSDTLFTHQENQG